jgi:hypothetical protein
MKYSELRNKWIKELNKKSNPLIHNCSLANESRDEETTKTFIKSSLEAMQPYMGELPEELKTKLIEEVASVVVRKVVVTLYGTDHKFHNKKQAENFLKDAMSCCDPGSAEFSRYAEALMNL